MGFWTRRTKELQWIEDQRQRLGAYYRLLAACELRLGATPSAPGAANSYAHVMTEMLAARDERPLDWQPGLCVHFDGGGLPIDTRFGFSIRTTGLDESGFITDGFIAREISETLMMLKAAEWADCFLDVGANVGYFSLLMAACGNPGLVCHAFEPVRAVYERIVASIEDNGVDAQVFAHHTAVGAATGEAEVRLHRQGSGGSSLCSQFPNPADDSGLREPVAITTMDAFLKAHRLAPVRGVLKIDVEGLEDQVLSGAETVLTAAHPPVVLVETFRRSLFGQSHDAEVLGRLKGWGYRVYGIREYHPRRSVLYPAFVLGRLRRSPAGNYLAFGRGHGDLEADCTQPVGTGMLIGLRRMARIRAFHDRCAAAAADYARKLCDRLDQGDPERPPEWSDFAVQGPDG
jgi:FkbM family methyltransferase